MKRFSDEIKNWSIEDRIKKAQEITKKLTHYVVEQIQLHENNQFLTYSPVLAKQIPRSRAAVAFNDLARSLLQYEIIRICTFWDEARSNSETIPTVIALIDDKKLIETLAVDLRSSRMSPILWEFPEEKDPERRKNLEAMMRLNNAEYAQEEAKKLEDGLQETIAQAREIPDSCLYKSVKTIRDRHLAHSLTKTFMEQKTEVTPMRYGDEGELLEKTIPIIQNLYLWVNGTGFDIAGECRELAKKRAAEFWNNLSFSLDAVR